MSELGKNAWAPREKQMISFKGVVKNFLGNTLAKNYSEIAQKLLESYKALGCNMSIKVHFFSPSFQCAVSDELDERFHQDLKVMEDTYLDILGVASKQLRLLHGRVGDSTTVVNSLSPQMSELVGDAIAS